VSIVVGKRSRREAQRQARQFAADVLAGLDSTIDDQAEAVAMIERRRQAMLELRGLLGDYAVERGLDVVTAREFADFQAADDPSLATRIRRLIDGAGEGV
jgi:hypothetical protein